MTNEELAGRIGGMESLLQTLVKSVDDRFNKMQSTLDNVAKIDKEVMALDIRQKAYDRDLLDLAHDIKNCRQHHVSQTDVTNQSIEKMASRMEKLEADRNRAHGWIMAMVAISGAFGLVLYVCGNWLYNRAEGNRDLNMKQESRIEHIESEFREVKKEVKRRDDK